jgi:hypothetical protein
VIITCRSNIKKAIFFLFWINIFRLSDGNYICRRLCRQAVNPKAFIVMFLCLRQMRFDAYICVIVGVPCKPTFWFSQMHILAWCVLFTVFTSHVRLLDLLCYLPCVSIDALYRTYLKYLHKLLSFVFLYVQTTTRGLLTMYPVVTGFWVELKDYIWQ